MPTESKIQDNGHHVNPLINLLPSYSSNIHSSSKLVAMKTVDTIFVHNPNLFLKNVSLDFST